MAGRTDVVGRPVAAVHTGVPLVPHARTAVGGCGRCAAAAVVPRGAGPGRRDQPGSGTVLACGGATYAHDTRDLSGGTGGVMCIRRIGTLCPVFRFVFLLQPLTSSVTHDDLDGILHVIEGQRRNGLSTLRVLVVMLACSFSGGGWRPWSCFVCCPGKSRPSRRRGEGRAWNVPR